MAVLSMTGFGQGESKTADTTYTVEIKSVNNRYLDIQIRSPRIFNPLEQKIKRYVSNKVSRGSIYVSIYSNSDDDAVELIWDKNAVDTYVGIFKQIIDLYKMDDKVNLAHLLNFSDFIKKNQKTLSETTLWRRIKPALDAALNDFILSRGKEGENISKDMIKILKNIEKKLEKIEKQAPLRLEEQIKKFRSKIETIVKNNIDETRIGLEVAIMADKLDISEECSRLRSHLKKTYSFFKLDEPIGKRLGFILQEFNREANTIASKANDAVISHLAVELKENIEKLREQSLNIE